MFINFQEQGWSFILSGEKPLLNPISGGGAVAGHRPESPSIMFLFFFYPNFSLNTYFLFLNTNRTRETQNQTQTNLNQKTQVLFCFYFLWIHTKIKQNPTISYHKKIIHQQQKYGSNYQVWILVSRIALSQNFERNESYLECSEVLLVISFFLYCSFVLFIFGFPSLTSLFSLTRGCNGWLWRQETLGFLGVMVSAWNFCSDSLQICFSLCFWFAAYGKNWLCIAADDCLFFAPSHWIFLSVL
jgi:hypothetical protein